MRVRNERILLILIAVALALNPLRAAFALPVPSVTDDSAHCAQMHEAAPAAGLNTDHTGAPGHGCGPGCDGDCCEGACSHCVHVWIAIPDTPAELAQAHNANYAAPAPRHQAGRNIHPPFRPPIEHS